MLRELSTLGRRPLTRAGSIAVAVILAVGMMPLAQVALNNAGLPTIAAVLADAPDPCDFGVLVGGGGSSADAGCTGVDIGDKPIHITKGGSGYPPCSIGQYPWKLPLDTSDINPTTRYAARKPNSVLVESIGNSADNYFWAGYSMTSPYFHWNGSDTTSSGSADQNSSSWFWQLAFPDMLAKSLQIWKNSGGSPILDMQSVSSRATDLNNLVLPVSLPLKIGYPTVTSYMISPGTWSSTMDPPVGMNAVYLFPSGGAEIDSGSSQSLLNSLNRPLVGNALLSRINANVEALYGVSSFDLAIHLYKTNKPKVESTTMAQAVIQSPVGLPVFIEILNSAGHAVSGPSGHSINGIPTWSLTDLLRLDAYSLIQAGGGVRWQVLAEFTGYRPKFASVDEVKSAFESVVSNSLNVAFNTANPYTGQEGVVWYPAFGIGAGCGSDPDLTFFGVGMSHNTSVACPMPSVGSNSEYSSLVNPEGCFLLWVRQRIPPPAINKPSWNAGKAQTNQTVQLAPDSPALLVNQPFNVSVDSSQLYPDGTMKLPQGTDLHIVSPFGASYPGYVDLYYTQVGITLSLGEDTFAAVPRDTTKPVTLYTNPITSITRIAGTASPYNFTMSGFSITPQSRLQQPKCLAAKTAAQLMSVCGVGFRLDTYGHLQPYFHISVHTWWDGVYFYHIVKAGGGYSTGWCGTYNGSDSIAPGTCSIIDYSVDPLFEFKAWQPDWNFSTTALGINGSPVSGAPVFGTTTPQDYERIGSPMYDVSYWYDDGTWNPTGAGFDISVAQVQTQGQPGGAIVAPPTLGPNPTPTPIPLPTPTPTPTPTSTPTPPVNSKTMTVCTFSSGLPTVRGSASTSGSVKGHLTYGTKIVVALPAVAGGSWAGAGGSCAKPAPATNLWYRIISPSQYAGYYVYAGALY